LDAKARMMDVSDGDGDTCYHFDTILEYDGRSGGDGRSEYSTSMSRFTILTAIKQTDSGHIEGKSCI